MRRCPSRLVRTRTLQTHCSTRVERNFEEHHYAKRVGDEGANIVRGIRPLGRRTVPAGVSDLAHRLPAGTLVRGLPTWYQYRGRGECCSREQLLQVWQYV